MRPHNTELRALTHFHILDCFGPQTQLGDTKTNPLTRSHVGWWKTGFESVVNNVRTASVCVLVSFYVPTIVHRHVCVCECVAAEASVLFCITTYAFFTANLVGSALPREFECLSSMLIGWPHGRCKKHWQLKAFTSNASTHNYTVLHITFVNFFSEVFNNTNFLFVFLQ